MVGYLIITCKFTSESFGARILKIGKHLAKIQTKVQCLGFFDSVYILMLRNTYNAYHQLSYGRCKQSTVGRKLRISQTILNFCAYSPGLSLLFYKIKMSLIFCSVQNTDNI